MKIQRHGEDPADSRRRIADGMVIGEWAAPDGWRLRRFDWPHRPPARGRLLFLGGRGDFFEKYLEAFAHWHAQRWSLTGFDWRGQGGSGRLLADRQICHLTDFDPLLADLSAFVSEWRAENPPGPHVVVAHSMGGHLALRLLAQNPLAFDAAALCAPMLGIKVKHFPTRPLHLAARAACLLGLEERQIWRRDPGNIPGRMTSCPERIADKIWWKSNHPDIASGSPSWGWTRAAFDSIERLNRNKLEEVDTRTLLLASELDPIIRIDAMRTIAGRLPNAELEVYVGGGHELLREADPIRLNLLARIDGFLAEGSAGKCRSACRSDL